MIAVAPPSIVTTQHPHGEEVAIEIGPQLTEKQVQINLKKRVKRLLLNPENQKCLDCSSIKPKWATLITVPPMHGHSAISFHSVKSPVEPDTFYIGGFCCLECSGAHRRLGTHIAFVRSVDLDTLKEHEVKALENGGNLLVNQIYEGNLHPKALDETLPTKPTSTSGQKAREAFIKSKYEQKLYMSIKDMVNFRQKMMCNSNNHMSSPTMSEKSEISPMSQQSIGTSPMHLQIFTSSPRTLAMIQKYMNPISKKKGLTKLKPFKRFSKKRFVKNSIKNLRRDGVGVNHTLNIMQTRSAEEKTSDSPNDTFGNDTASVSSVKSSMSATFRRSMIRGAKLLTPIFSKMKSSSSKKKSLYEKDSHTPLVPSYHATQDDDDNYTPSSRNRRVMKRNKKDLQKHHQSKKRTHLFSKKQEINPSPASSTSSLRDRFSKILRTPKRTSNSFRESNVTQKNQIFFPENLYAVRESGINEEIEGNDFVDEKKHDEIKAMKQCAKKFDKVFTKFGKGKKEGHTCDRKHISLTRSDETDLLLSAEGSDYFETWRSDGNFSTRHLMKTSNGE
jgi:hypothetical protein